MVMLTLHISPTDDPLVAPFGGPPWRLPITLAAGQKLARGSVLGESTEPTVTAAPKDGGNTGTGTLNNATALRSAAPGTYAIRASKSGTSLGFDAIGPDGTAIGSTVAGQSGAWTFSGPIAFTITAGDKTFTAGDGFDVTVTAPVDAYRLSEAASLDGSALPTLVLAQDTDATKGPVETIAYRDGALRVEALILGEGQTVESIEAPLCASGIVLVQLPR